MYLKRNKQQHTSQWARCWNDSRLYAQTIYVQNSDEPQYICFHLWKPKLVPDEKQEVFKETENLWTSVSFTSHLVAYMNKQGTDQQHFLLR